MKGIQKNTDNVLNYYYFLIIFLYQKSVLSSNHLATIKDEIAISQCREFYAADKQKLSYTTLHHGGGTRRHHDSCALNGFSSKMHFRTQRQFMPDAKARMSQMADDLAPNSNSCSLHLLQTRMAGLSLALSRVLGRCITRM